MGPGVGNVMSNHADHSHVGWHVVDVGIVTVDGWEDSGVLGCIVVTEIQIQIK